MTIDQNKTVAGVRLFDLKAEPVKELAKLSRKAAADGAVLIKNDGNALPLKKGEKISIFGRIQTTYYKSGTGSGGMVNVEYVTNILDSLRNDPDVKVNEALAKVYEDWIKENPFDVGVGWGGEPWCQKEMPLDESVAKAAAEFSDKAIVVIGRSAGESHDNSEVEGSYLLTKTELDMIKTVRANFKQVIVLLNVGNIIDMNFVNDCNIDAVMYLWQGGMEGGNAAADLLTGKVTPSGKLSDTVAYSIEDYPAHGNFGDPKEAKYVEDIYVGYRYFETVAKDRVQYEFGFGLSYTKFDITVNRVYEHNDQIKVDVTVKNVGDYDGKEVVEVYFGAPQGKLGKPLKQLIAYKKTKLLTPGESENIILSFEIAKMASYDDSGVTGHKSAFVLESGEYNIFVGNSVRSAKCSYTYNQSELIIVRQLEEALAPVKDFERMHPIISSNGCKMEYEPVPKRTVDLDARINERRPIDIEYTGDRGIKLIDVKDGKATMTQFIAQLSDKDLMCLVRGEGMNSPKVTPGTGSAFGGVTDSLIDFGIPVACTTDGPSGIRMDSGAKATAMPNGVCLCCSWDDELVKELYTFEGMELFAYHIDSLLGPGINIHRHPLNGRNFEYFSEDPFITGKMAAAIVSGINRSGCTATIKHFCANNQEAGRNEMDSVVSERALREIYLKPFEIAIHEGGKTAVMTTYGSLNGFWTMGSYDLVTTVLRREWGFDGIVMSDWWARANLEGEQSIEGNLKQMVRAQNDLFMVCTSSEEFEDNQQEGLNEGFITRGELQRCAKNILTYIMNAPVFDRFVLNGCFIPKINATDDSNTEEFISFENIESGKEYSFDIPLEGSVFFDFFVESEGDELAQSSVNLTLNDEAAANFTIKGGEKLTFKHMKYLAPHNTHRFSLKFDPICKVKKVSIKM